MPKESIVIIDRSLFMRTTIRILLWKKGCSILEADNETSAVTLIVNKKPLLVLMAMDFARQNKMKFVRTLKNIHKCPVIIYGDIVTRTDVITGFKASVDDFLLNPLQQKERLIQYFTHTPSDIRRKRLYGHTGELEFNQAKGWIPKDRLPVREGGLMSWERAGAV
ncbi:MAG: response regulator [Peptococcaceae bacterium]|nr:response regulator [Peptococcaceae bacterium]